MAKKNKAAEEASKVDELVVNDPNAIAPEEVQEVVEESTEESVEESTPETTQPEESAPETTQPEESAPETTQPEESDPEAAKAKFPEELISTLKKSPWIHSVWMNDAGVWHFAERPGFKAIAREEILNG